MSVRMGIDTGDCACWLVVNWSDAEPVADIPDTLTALAEGDDDKALELLGGPP